jgi:hypothetical protein
MIYKNYSITLKHIKPKNKEYSFWAASLRDINQADWVDCVVGDSPKVTFYLAREAINYREGEREE